MTENQEVTPEVEFEWMTPKEVGALFRVDTKTVGRWVTSGTFDKYNIRIVMTPGGHRRFNRDDMYTAFDNLNPQQTNED